MTDLPAQSAPARDLYAIHYSPWSERARWALDHHGVSYREHEYVPMVSEPLVRLRTRRFGGRITVPLLVAGGGEVLMDSLDIALYADVHGSGERLVPPGRRAEVERYNELSEVALVAGRARITPAVTADAEARVETIPGALRWLAGPIAKLGAFYFERKYALSAVGLQRARQRAEDACVALERGLERGGGEYLLGSFSYADIVMASMLQVVEPVSSPALRMSDAMRRCWRDDELAKRFSQLVAWRDRLYREHRG